MKRNNEENALHSVGFDFPACFFFSYLTVNWSLEQWGEDEKTIIEKTSIGGPFSALRANGTQITWDDMKGRPHILFFGFTHCPDICPTTLHQIGLWLDQIGHEADKIDAYFVTVDPMRDKPEILSAYLSAFNKRITGITGSKNQIEKIIKAWGIFAEKVSFKDEDYVMNHISSVYLMDSSGKFWGTIGHGEDMKIAKQKLLRLLSSAN
ncbi:SCO family protein [Candidatus Endowatersipora endosymbiont of Watersipora subatra]|uniref:SCO family protein n=1 Tax=Candidatus Endowatersipora endosymbiont of Watersipora subatra TaxID=3077946 RepID=UPI00312C993D